jgi:flagella basal body P-ring formation protein FlgA
MKYAALLVLAVATSAPAADWEPLERIRAAAEAAVKQTRPDATVTAATLDERLRLPACDTAPRAGAQPQAGGAQVSVAVQCAGPTAWTLYVPVKINEVRRVLVLRRSLLRGATLAADAVGFEERDTAGLSFGYIDDLAGVAGKSLKRPLAAGAVLTPDALEAARLVRRGERVTLIGRAGPVEVRAEGKALADGGSGQSISVENLSSRRIVEGVVLDAGTVEVRL